MMKLPKIQGVIRRRLLVNFRARPEVVADFLPDPFEPKLHDGWSILGICLIRPEVSHHWIMEPDLVSKK